MLPHAGRLISEKRIGILKVIGNLNNLENIPFKFSDDFQRR
jgi:hypothetical protein